VTGGTLLRTLEGTVAAPAAEREAPAWGRRDQARLRVVAPEIQSFFRLYPKATSRIFPGLPIVGVNTYIFPWSRSGRKWRDRENGGKV